MALERQEFRAFASSRLPLIITVIWVQSMVQEYDFNWSAGKIFRSVNGVTTWRKSAVPGNEKRWCIVFFSFVFSFVLLLEKVFLVSIHLKLV
jgi:hypothetical protein